MKEVQSIYKEIVNGVHLGNLFFLQLFGSPLKICMLS